MAGVLSAHHDCLHRTSLVPLYTASSSSFSSSFPLKAGGGGDVSDKNAPTHIAAAATTAAAVTVVDGATGAISRAGPLKCNNGVAVAGKSGRTCDGRDPAGAIAPALRGVR